ncbi:hypothetical protein E2562_029123 [Oryza meyeriana var. granulata]|uniref:Nucleotide-binding protein-like n=1 Tax=Oryza meyeriana var. granulata TaxID=110450 RepID=A0A6G1ECU0_9ORYZ|nr:hypothetical protein E2562_029123 [Oryza meyeriana var. granulata]
MSHLNSGKSGFVSRSRNPQHARPFHRRKGVWPSLSTWSLRRRPPLPSPTSSHLLSLPLSHDLWRFPTLEVPLICSFHAAAAAHVPRALPVTKKEKRGLQAVSSRCSGSPLARRCYSAVAKGGPSIAGVSDIIAVASGKGGVGKSTTAVNIAVALAKEFRLKVGLLDADIYGPSIPTMMNLHEKPEVSEDMRMIPVENHGVRCMSIGFLVDKDASIVWRGPMVMSALEKLTRGVAWGNLDVLVVDMPPGTGDAQLSMSQRLRLSGALIVSTSQDIALIDARRGANMFRKVQVPILGLVENMSCFKCPKCGEKSYIFGEGGAQRTAEEMDMKLIGAIPLEIDIRTGSDEGKPIVISSPDSASAQAYIQVAEKVTRRLKELAEERQMGPEILL